jgi:hypothetical protein
MKRLKWIGLLVILALAISSAASAQEPFVIFLIPSYPIPIRIPNVWHYIYMFSDQFFLHHGTYKCDSLF